MAHRRQSGVIISIYITLGAVSLPGIAAAVRSVLAEKRPRERLAEAVDGGRSATPMLINKPRPQLHHLPYVQRVETTAGEKAPEPRNAINSLMSRHARTQPRRSP